MLSYFNSLPIFIESSSIEVTEKQMKKKAREDREMLFTEPSFNDGLLEVVGMKGVAHLGAIQTGVATARRIGQGREIEITTEQILPVQVDGEPWRLIPCRVTISYFNQANFIVRKG